MQVLLWIVVYIVFYHLVAPVDPLGFFFVLVGGMAVAIALREVLLCIFRPRKTDPNSPKKPRQMVSFPVQVFVVLAAGFAFGMIVQGKGLWVMVPGLALILINRVLWQIAQKKAQGA